MIIPTISPLLISDVDLERLMQIGFCYVQISDESLLQHIQQCIQITREFNKNSQEFKEQWRVKEPLLAADRYQGYALRSQSTNTKTIEQFFFEPDAPFGPYAEHSLLIEAINKAFTNQIYFPLVKGIFEKLQFSEAHFIEAAGNPYCSLVFQFYPSLNDDKKSIRFNAHKDFGILTVLYFEESGLEVSYAEEWIAIPPKKGCVVVNIGNALEQMTGKHCHSPLHRVTNATDDRVSMVYFYNANNHKKVRNYIDNTTISSSGAEFFKKQFTEYYEVDN